ncbi:nuclear transport factor 2 family protein [Roseomonas sp. OT10]|uniref:nuclear transport factor 2 family protein n=1 Tax=Roseomonas cutis TaxID=2897332 RepID=UPI001E3C681C|nr:nuclear transport factor 2 family protein [Roseomonas sp. OT10]UFN50994.1 nuclear transport factor 2 family protein [Roseomonas sp. OT10]
MTLEDASRALFDRWERVWHDGEFGLIPSCVAPTYIRHDHLGDRTVTPDSYKAELETVRADRPGIRVAVYDHAFTGNRAWYRFEFRWNDPATGEARTQAGMQSYRIEDGKLAETWISLLAVGSTWPDKVAQASWTSPPPVRPS